MKSFLLLVVCTITLMVPLIQANPLTKLPAVYSKQPSVEWEKCENKEYEVDVTNVKLSPEKPDIGQDITIEATFNPSKDVTVGPIKYTVKYYLLGFPITVRDGEKDTCAIMRDAPSDCPKLTTNEYTVDVEENTDGGQKGRYTVEVKLMNEQGNGELGCIKFDFNIE